MCEAGRGLHGLLAVFSFAASRRRPKRHSTQKPDREPRELAPLLPAPSVLCITAVISKTSYTACHQNLCQQKVASIALKFRTWQLREVLKRVTFEFSVLRPSALGNLAGWRSSCG